MDIKFSSDCPSCPLWDDDFGCLAESGDDCPTEEIPTAVEETE